MKIYSWNVNSLRSCENSFIEFINTYNPDIVFIQELRANPDQISFFLKTLSGYSFLLNDSGRPGYGGTAIYYKNELDVKSIARNIGNQILDSEGRVIHLQVGDIHLYNFYTPNGNSSGERLKFKLKYYDEILNLAKDLTKKNMKIIIGGDLNVAHTHLDLWPKSSQMSGYLPEEKKWFDDMLKVGFLDSFRMFQKDGEYYTWWSMRDRTRKQNKGWRYDYFLLSSNMKNEVKSAGILREVFGSDHCPIWVEI
ncbi:exodeoxyribonuclease III [Candidatus Dojkabacteria bacterium]|jgi:exodeoxyribonuclease-3|nr:exodeoxyribonuclease III [Candidatus Dojkabacteria bacterium]